jgi:signal transduction histidine kinase
MPSPLPRSEGNAVRLRRNASIGALGLGILASVFVVGLVVSQAYVERANHLESEKDSISRLAQVVAVEMGDLFDEIKFFFKAADLWLIAHPDADPRFDPDFGKLVDQFRAVMRNRVDIRLVSASGGLYYIPSTGPEPKADVSDRPYFQAQASPATRGFYVAEPVLSRVTGKWGIPISYPLTSGVGGMTVIFAALEMPTLVDLYDTIRPKPGGSISLIRRDGTFLARIPFDEAYMGKRVSEDAEAWWASIEKNEIMTMRAVSTDNAERIIATKRIPSPEIVVSVSAKVDDVLSTWKRDLGWKALGALILFAIISLVSVLLMRAIREVNAAQSELAGSVARLRESDATKDKLFSILAHDLRGPIGGVCSLLESMARDIDVMSKEDVGQCLSALRIGASNTYQLLENILAWSRSKRGDTTFLPERTPLRPLVEECAGVYDLAIEGKRLKLRIDVDPALEARVDRNLIKVVLRNLVSNAIKFSNPGGTVSVEARRAEGGTKLTVRDEGIGMDAETRDGLFSLGGTKSRAGTASEGGSGLGLVLCVDIVSLHGGSLGVESENGEGSAFSVFLPD